MTEAALEQSPHDLTAKQEAFCQEYLIDLNATQAAIRAGYSPDTAGSIGSENLKKPEIQSRLADLMAERQKRTEVTQDRVLKEYAKLAFANIGEFLTVLDDGLPIVDLSQMTPDQAAALSEVTVDQITEGKGDERKQVGQRVKIKLADKKGALDSIAKHLGMFNEKITLAGDKENPLKANNGIDVMPVIFSLLAAHGISPDEVTRLCDEHVQRKQQKDGSE